VKKESVMLVKGGTRIAKQLVLGLMLIGSTLAGDSWVVREDGAGPVRAGMTLAQLSAALHQELAADEKTSKVASTSMLEDMTTSAS
jgi:hypothetical protein